MTVFEDAKYYSHVRKEITPHLPMRVTRMLDIGCGRGDTAAWIRETRGSVQTMGIEIDPEAAGTATEKLDFVFCGNFETMELPEEFCNFDLILCLDVLEHLVDPWRAIHRIQKMLAPGGILITSIPNVRYFRVLISLIFRGRWDYEQSGILDRTHLRFFTRANAMELVAGAGLDVIGISATGLEPGRKTRYLNAITCSLLKRFFEYQYVIKASKPASTLDSDLVKA